MPSEGYEHGEWKILIADKAHCVRINSDGGHRYSVPVEYVRKPVSVRVCRDKIEIYDPKTLLLIGTHERCTNAHGSKTHILEEHLTAAEKNYRRDKGDWINLFIEKGLEPAIATEFITALWDGRGSFSSGRTCNAVRGLFKDFSPRIVTQAIGAALEIERINYQQIKTLCERYDFASRTNQSLFGGSTNDYQTTPHENFRNNYK